MRFEFPANHDPAPMLALRRAILDSPVAIGLARAEAFTRVWQANEGAAWIVKKALALREYFRTVPLYIRPGDLLAGAISETPGAMPVMVELGIAEESVYINEQPQRSGYLAGKVPQPIVDYWEDRNLWGQYRAVHADGRGQVAGAHRRRDVQVPLQPGPPQPRLSGAAGGRAGWHPGTDQGAAGGGDRAGQPGVSDRRGTRAARPGGMDRTLRGLPGGRSGACADPARSAQLAEMARNAAHVAHQPPATFHQAMQLVWFAHQAIHIEGHGYSCTPDRLDQILYPFYRADRDAGRLDDDFALTLCENFLLKQRDNTFWGIEHNLTQGLVVGGATPDGADQTNELSWLFIKATGAMSLPEPLVWVRWHPSIDPDFFDFCLQNLAGSTCFPLMMSDTAVPAMFMALGASREDAFDYVPVGCNELGIPGKAYFNPGAHVDYPRALELALTAGRGYDGRGAVPDIPPPDALRTFDDLTAAVGRVLRWQVATSYAASMPLLMAQMRWGQTPLTSCFFDGCIERARDLAEGTKYNILSCGGAFFANMVDGLAAIREVVYERGDATPRQIADGLPHQLRWARAAPPTPPARAQAWQRRRAARRPGRARGTAARRAGEGDLPRSARRHAVRQRPHHPVERGAGGRAHPSHAGWPAGRDAARHLGRRGVRRRAARPHRRAEIHPPAQPRQELAMRLQRQPALPAFGAGRSRRPPAAGCHAARLLPGRRAGDADQQRGHSRVARGPGPPRTLPRPGGARARASRRSSSA